ncbi:aminoacyl-tRNA hydrolase [Corynebacterium sp. CCM 8863]|uniref:Peptidyl-tRNA hydrolase n=1 Tax=Corynebacterium meridianum TaxID=2765363 RepID=A0A934M7X4_9CORY|nr:aminoacyl-tRNA hydrolase [Corynebacterium meridianum]
MFGVSSPDTIPRNNPGPPTGPLLVVGLGNPGPKYAATRHNVGFMVVDELAERATPMPATFSVHKRSNAEIAQIRISGRPVILAKPRSFMNLSGGPVKALASYFGVEPADIVVIHDELDLEPGVVRLKLGGGENGHNGLKSTSKSLGTRDYIRVRMGIGRPPGRMDPADYVLRPIPQSACSDLAIQCADAADGVELIAESGLAIAQNTIHSR